MIFCLMMLRALLHDEPEEPVKTELYDRADDLGKEWDRELNNRDEALRTQKLYKDGRE